MPGFQLILSCWSQICDCIFELTRFLQKKRLLCQTWLRFVISNLEWLYSRINMHQSITWLVIQLSRTFTWFLRTFIRLSSTFVDLSRVRIQLSKTFIKLSRTFNDLLETFVEVKLSKICIHWPLKNAYLSLKHFIKLSGTLIQLSRVFIDLSRMFNDLLRTFYYV